MNIDDLRYFTVTYDMRNISQTADVLYVTRQALSKRIAGLESELGARLFERTNSGLVPTELADAFYRFATATLDGYGAILNHVDAMLAQRKTVRLLSSGFCNTLLDFGKITEFNQLQDEYVVEFDSGKNRQNLHRLRNREAEVVFAKPFADDTGLAKQLVAREKAVVLVGASAPFADREAFYPEDLADLPVYTPVLFAENNPELGAILANAGVATENNVHHSRQIASFVGHGNGVAVLNQSLAEALARAHGGLAVKEFVAEGADFEVYLLALEERLDEPGVRELFAFCKDNASAICNPQ